MKGSSVTGETRGLGRLVGKRALVLGASGGLGGDIARSYAAEGAAVVVVSRTRARLEALASEIRATAGTPVEVVTADLCDQESVRSLADASWAAFDGVDVVVSNAVPNWQQVAAGDLLTTPDEKWATTMELIAWGPLRLMRTLGPKMMNAGGGSIIGIGSISGISPMPGFDAYGLGKAALHMLIRYMAKEWGKAGIRANVLSPGTIVTSPEMEKDLDDRTRSLGVLDRISLGRFGRNMEVVGAAIFLASDESSYVSGQILAVDGGRL